MTKRLYIETVGCQMNVLDSELVVAGLLQAGYELVDSPRDADTILFNTCSVRQHAEDKIYSALGRLRPLKERNPETIIGVLGCMAQKDQEQIFRRAPHVDLVVGPGQFNRLPETARGSRRAAVPRAAAGGEPRPPQGGPLAGRARASPASIRRDRRSCGRRRSRRSCGSCSAATSSAPTASCPASAGPEQSRPAGEIVAEVRHLADDGCQEVTLLGQTVNSYQDSSDGQHAAALRPARPGCTTSPACGGSSSSRTIRGT